MSLRHVKVTYSDGHIIHTSMAAHLTDKEIYDYFCIGQWINVGNGPNDNMQQVTKCEIIPPLMGLTVEVYKGRFNAGSDMQISDRVKQITLVGEGIPTLNEADDSAPAFKVVKRNIHGIGEYLHVEPVERPTGLGWMYGGNICYTSDSRFPNTYPLKIHDRQEFNQRNDD